eukprot:GHVN01040888.1.p1 GENE.GHVN01040888.1~~GHVN01040888.1.p1  ORF type:complete len:803 (+),score=124.76 GHVN01040888.1:65-2473(+)
MLRHSKLFVAALLFSAAPFVLGSEGDESQVIDQLSGSESERILQAYYVPVGGDMDMEWGVAEAAPLETESHSDSTGAYTRGSVAQAPNRQENRQEQVPARLKLTPQLQTSFVEETAESDAKLKQLAEEIEKMECLDAKARGYESPFTCCSIQDGDWWDRKTWDCNRVPTNLDAVFLRHFVRLSDAGISSFLQGTTREVRIRALWLIESIDPAFAGQNGVLRGGKFFNICDDPQAAASWMPTSQIRALERVFREYTNEQTLRGLCKSFTNALFPSEADFANEELIKVVIAPPPFPLDNDKMMDVINMSLAPDVPVARWKISQQGKPRDNFAEDLNLEEIKQRLRKDRLTARSQASQESVVDEVSEVSEETMDEIDRRRSQLLELRQAEEAAMKRVQELQELLQRLQDTAEGPQAVSPRASGLDPDDFGAPVLSPYSPDDESMRGYLGRAPRMAVPDALLDHLSSSSSSPYRRQLQRRAQQMTLDEFERIKQSEEEAYFPQFSMTGPSTVRVEQGTALLLFEQASLSIASGIRNMGTFFIGEATVKSCLDEYPVEEHGRCRVPSLSSEGYIVATEPVNVMWLELTQAATPQGPNGETITRQLWKGVVKYDTDMPGSEKSVLTIFGHVGVETIAPGFTLSFRRLGFPAHPSIDRSVIEVLNTKESSDLLIYMDVFDDDGYIHCCEGTYEDRIAEFEVTGVNLKLMRYHSFFKEIGDPSRGISEQILIRAPRITTDQMFDHMDDYISDDDAVLTNTEVPFKLAGINRDVLYFQCLISCQITNQSFLRESPYFVVQVKRAPPRRRFD